MSSLVKFTPLCGARSEQPLCYLLEIDDNLSHFEMIEFLHRLIAC